MSISSRIHDTVNDWANEWGSRLAGWTINIFASAARRGLSSVSPENDIINKFLSDYEERTGTSFDLKYTIDWFKSMEDSPVGWVVGLIILAAQSLGLALAGSEAVGNEIRYAQNRVLRTNLVDPVTAITAFRRRGGTDMTELDTVKAYGFDDNQIRLLDEATRAFPGIGDIIAFYAHEVFEPNMVEKYGLGSELPEYEGTLFQKIGMDQNTAKQYWINHWQHASWVQVLEMLHRELITEADVHEWFRLVEIPPYWRQLLIDSAYTWPTRVDVRRWWDMRTIDEAELRRLYKGMGYRGDNLENYVLWTKVYVAWPDLSARWTKGWITEEEVRQELIGLGMPSARVEELIQTKIKAEEPERTVAERDITKTDIYKGVKQGVITREQGIILLQDLGYSEDEADYLLTINIPQDQEDEVVAERELTKTDIREGIKKEILTEAQAREKLLELRYNPADVEFLLKIYKVVAKPPEDPVLKEASKADIVKGVQKGLITQSEGNKMLLELGYDSKAAEFILLVQTTESPFSPKSFNEFKDVTYKYRRAAGMESKPIPEDIKDAADNLVKARLEVETLEAAVTRERGNISDEPGIPEAATEKLKQLEVALNRARAELQRIQVDYDTKVAAWRRGLAP